MYIINKFDLQIQNITDKYILDFSGQLLVEN
jgi:hypothetical protein